jgi:serine/threonine protein kinase
MIDSIPQDLAGYHEHHVRESIVIGVDREIEAKYEILAKMGEGGMGSVFKVRHKVFQDVRVVKTAKYDNNIPGVRTRFIGEAKRGYQFRHPSIARVIDFDVTADGTAYIVMEFIDGLNLRQVLSVTGKPLNPRQVIDIGIQTLGALEYLHERGVVHRDISPENLMLTRDENDKPLVKLIDLGIAKSIEASQNLTLVGKFIGKVLYAAPEQFGGQVDQRSDLYSLGVVMYELLTSSLPVRSASHRAVIAAHLSGELLSFDETDPRGRVPMDLRAVIMRSLQRDLDLRYQTTAEFAEALKAVDTGSGIIETDTVQISSNEITVVKPTRSEQLAWEAALAADTLKALEDFLDRYPSSIHARTARAHLQAIEQIEEDDWNEASREQTTDGWKRFLEKHPDSPRAARARRRIEKIATDEVDAKSTVRPGTGARLPSSDDDIDCLGWTGAERVDTAEAWRHYLERYPGSSRSSDARQRLAAAESREVEARRRPIAPGKATDGDLTDSQIPTIEGIEPSGEAKRITFSAASGQTPPVNVIQTPSPRVPAVSTVRTSVFSAWPARMGAAALAVLVLVLTLYWQGYLRSAPSDEKHPLQPPAGDTSNTSTYPPAVDEAELVINAFPWGEVKSVKSDATGQERLPAGQPLYTPARLKLPPGNYTVVLTNPNSGKHATRSVSLLARKITYCEAALDTVDASEYLAKLHSRP